MENEMEALQRIETWSLVPWLPTMNVISNNWIFKTKLTPQGMMDQPKVQLVAKGYHQESRVNYLETYSLIV